jgi:hypothetical protein
VLAARCYLAHIFQNINIIRIKDTTRLAVKKASPFKALHGLKNELAEAEDSREHEDYEQLDKYAQTALECLQAAEKEEEGGAQGGELGSKKGGNGGGGVRNHADVDLVLLRADAHLVAATVASMAGRSTDAVAMMKQVTYFASTHIGTPTWILSCYF